MKTPAKQRATSRLDQPATVSGLTLQPLSPRTWDILAMTGHIAAIVEGYEPEKQGFEPLYVIAWVHSNVDLAEGMEAADIVKAAKAESKNWSFAMIQKIGQWLAGQAEAITAAMAIAEPPKARRVRQATSRTP
jgi:hypothetical protein